LLYNTHHCRLPRRGRTQDPKIEEYGIDPLKVGIVQRIRRRIDTRLKRSVLLN
jgi:hypothetical protein